MDEFSAQTRGQEGSVVTAHKLLVKRGNHEINGAPSGQFRP